MIVDDYIISDKTDNLFIDKDLYGIEVVLSGNYKDGEIYHIILDDKEVIAGKKLDALLLAIETFNKMK